MLLDIAARTIAGDSATMSTFERAMIEPPLSRMIQRTPAVSLAFARYADPVSLISGLSLWLARVIGEVRIRRAATVNGVQLDPAAPVVAPTPVESDGAGPAPADIDALLAQMELRQ